MPWVRWKAGDDLKPREGTGWSAALRQLWADRAGPRLCPVWLAGLAGGAGQAPALGMETPHVRLLRTRLRASPALHWHVGVLQVGLRGCRVSLGDGSAIHLESPWGVG